MTGSSSQQPPVHSRETGDATGRNFLVRYMRWLHTRWPASTVEPLPVVREDGSTAVPGLFVVGDLAGVPLLKLSADSGVRAIDTIIRQGLPNRAAAQPGVLDVIIVGAGVSGMSAALEAAKRKLSFQVLEASTPFNTIVNFPRQKPIYTYPTDLTPRGEMQFRADVKEALVDELRAQTRNIDVRIAQVHRITRAGGLLEVHLESQQPLIARAVIVAIGRSGNFRQLNVPGEDLGHVFNRLHDPKEFAGKSVVVVGGGDSALECAIALAQFGARVTLSYRKPEFSRPKPANIEKLHRLLLNPWDSVPVGTPSSERVTTAVGDYMEAQRSPGSLRLELGSRLTGISPGSVTLVRSDGQTESVPADAVFAMIGREPPLDFFRRSGVPIRGERTAGWWVRLILILLACVFIYHWKKSDVVIAPFPPFTTAARIGDMFRDNGWFPYNVPGYWSALGNAFSNRANLLGTLKVSVGEPGFYYSLAYCACVVLFGFWRIRRRRTRYVTVQTISLMLFQVIPLFLLPYLLLPWMGNNGWFDAGVLKWFADQLFPTVDYGHGREYWRAFGFVLAWPLFIWNVFTEQPLWLWLGISLVQTFAIIPLIIYFWGKGAYCGWVCSCGALAETLGDTQRTKMPHGPAWNRLNMLGQVFLALALLLLVLRIVGWMFPAAATPYHWLLRDLWFFNYVWFVDLLWAGILGVGLYWHFSGRVWCRFACPLAALMHIYTRFSRFRILADKKKCISCNVCTSVCHQGIDVMNFANKGLAMEDPQCVRCSACVQSCPTGVLSFGQVDRRTGAVLHLDRLSASPVQRVEMRINGKSLKH